jgi:hypothetical protein
MNDFKDIFHSILGGVTAAVDALYPDYPIYADEVPQKTPDRFFTASIEEPDSRRAFGRRYELKGIVDIAYHSPIMAVDRERELNDVYATITSNIDVVECGDIKVALSTKSRGKETIPLHIRCPFTLHLYISQDAPLMGRITIKEAIK